jgi:predicted acyltransferase (DUF342 family)
MGERNNVFGSLRAKGDVTIGEETRIHGDVSTRGGRVVVEEGARVLGDLSCTDLDLHEGATVDGTVRARGEMRIRGSETARSAE